MYVSIYVSMLVFMYLSMHVCMYVRMYVYMYVYMYLYMYIYVSMHVGIYICMHACMYVYIYVWIHECVYQYPQCHIYFRHYSLTIIEGEDVLDPSNPEVTGNRYELSTVKLTVAFWFSPDSTKLLCLTAAGNYKSNGTLSFY